MIGALMTKPGINWEAVSRGGETPLMFAIESGNKRVLKVCLDCGFNPFAFNNFLMTPIDYAKKFPSVDHQAFVSIISDAQQQWRNYYSN